MKLIVIAFLSLSFGSVVTAQVNSESQPIVDFDAKRKAIAESRGKLEARFLLEDVACYQKFAVNNCLENVNAQRSKAMAKLRKQEIELNDEDRKKKGQQQISNMQEKSRPEKLAQDSDSRTQSQKDFHAPQLREKESAQKRNATAGDVKANREAHAAKLQANKQKMQARSVRQASAAEEAKKFGARQIEANERRVQHSAEQAKRTKPAAQSLPIPQ